MYKHTLLGKIFQLHSLTFAKKIHSVVMVGIIRCLRLWDLMMWGGGWLKMCKCWAKIHSHQLWEHKMGHIQRNFTKKVNFKNLGGM